MTTTHPSTNNHRSNQKFNNNNQTADPIQASRDFVDQEQYHDDDDDEQVGQEHQISAVAFAEDHHTSVSELSTAANSNAAMLPRRAGVVVHPEVDESGMAAITTILAPPHQTRDAVAGGEEDDMDSWLESALKTQTFEDGGGGGEENMNVEQGGGEEDDMERSQ